MPLSPGTRLGPYEVLAPIGAGGMGEVYKARDTRLDRAVAIKVLPANLSSNPELRARFDREAKAISSLSHPNICTLYDVGHQEGHDFLVMEFLEGETLADRLKSGPLPIEEVLKISIEIADALDKAHRRGLVHRDLKPANLFLTGHGATKILDFGLAKTAIDKDDWEGVTLGSEHQLTSPGTAVGTVAYMSPEQARGEPMDARSDLFSFGVLLYEATTGCRPFLGATTAILFDAILNRPPKSVTELNAKAPAALKRIITRLLAKSPASRYQSAQAVLDELRTARDAVRRGFGSSGTVPDTTPSIAVLPFANLSADPDQEYFSDGLAEEIINALTQVSGLKVIARTSAFAFKGKNEDIRKIAETLGVTNVLEGSVRRAGGRIRVTAQLIQATDGMHLWSQRYDREMVDVFAIQDEISAAIANQLKVQLTDRKRSPHSVAAYEAYLEGRYHSQKASPAGLAKALPCFERAIALDSSYAPAYHGMAEYYWILAVVGLADPRVLLAKAAAASRRALELDETMAESHATLGAVSLALDYDFPQAERHIRRALELNSIALSVSCAYGQWYLPALGRLDEAAEVINRALGQDPLSPVLRLVKGWNLVCSRRYEEAVEELQRVLDLDPNNLGAQFYLALTRLQQKHFDEALAIAEKVVREHGRRAFALFALGMAHAKAGHIEEARGILAELMEPASWTHVPAHAIADLYGALGELDLAFEWAHKAIDQRDPNMLTVKADPSFDPLRSDPRYPPLLKRMNLAEPRQ
jgi:serine/threonine protein kinase/Tfp pilus assembly protein PilF